MALVEKSFLSPNEPNRYPTEELNQINFTPKLRYFAVGPTKRVIKCPVCGTRCETNEKDSPNLKECVNQILCCFSCCFPIFWASCVYICVLRFTKRKRQVCSTCAAQLGFYRCPS